MPVVEEYRSEACRLLDCLKAIQVEWRDYRKVIDARVCLRLVLCFCSIHSCLLLIYLMRLMMIIDLDGPIPGPGGNVVIPEIQVQLEHNSLSQLQQTIDPLRHSDEYDVFEQVVHFVQVQTA